MNTFTFKKLKISLLITILSLLLFACAQQQALNTPSSAFVTSTPQDGPPEKTIDISSIPDAVPQKRRLSYYGNPKYYEVFGKRYYVMPSSYNYKERGVASWYGRKFHGKRTSSGVPYNMHGMTAAHKTLPLPTYVKVTNLINNRQVILKVNDRGPFHDNRIIDLSHTAAVKLGIKEMGTGWVEVEAINLASSPENNASHEAQAMAVYLQLGVFNHSDNAYKFSDQVNLLLASHSAQINKKLKNGEQKYHVRIGPLNTAEQVEQLAKTLQKNGITQHYMVAAD